MTLRSHPNSSPQRQWLWRWELTQWHIFLLFSLQTVLSWLPSAEGCPADASGQTAVQSRHVSSSTGDFETGQCCEMLRPHPALTSPEPAMYSLPFSSDCTLCLCIFLTTFSVVGAVSPGCSWMWWWVTVAQSFRHCLPSVSVNANCSLIAQKCLNEKLLLDLKR